ncbi:unnamed protein product [Dicrocoelium dendriticum]|nr:unnamed protein product [Dicrocoelium dendriticum]
MSSSACAVLAKMVLKLVPHFASLMCLGIPSCQWLRIKSCVASVKLRNGVIYVGLWALASAKALFEEGKRLLCWDWTS